MNPFLHIQNEQSLDDKSESTEREPEPQSEPQPGPNKSREFEITEEDYDESLEQSSQTLILETESEQTISFGHQNPTDKGIFSSILKDSDKRFIIDNGPCRPLGP
ncbi:hypothetical protein TcasGA2_TC033892 [Tribolium castaneum]|uniref:Uncharacterized protein n=1 Tax=Tribolium castaneum TaxID=7070 RepID=A0A139WEF2_TRICA|nr:hypothetical protein TcasGA2_TC033892 [Tribolium castaneum]